jgi:hypothetical protein
MNNAVMSPHAMNAPMFGMIIPARYPPRRWMVALAPVPSIAGEYGIASMFNSPSVELVVDAVGGGNELLLIPHVKIDSALRSKSVMRSGCRSAICALEGTPLPGSATDAAAHWTAVRRAC